MIASLFNTISRLKPVDLYFRQNKYEDTSCEESSLSLENFNRGPMKKFGDNGLITASYQELAQRATEVELQQEEANLNKFSRESLQEIFGSRDADFEYSEEDELTLDELTGVFYRQFF